MKQFTKRMSANEEVVQETITAIRKRIITLQYEIEFAKRTFNGIEDKETEYAKELAKGIDALQEQVNSLIVRLNFYKEKRTELQAKKAMRALKKFPETINQSDLVEA